MYSTPRDTVLRSKGTGSARQHVRSERAQEWSEGPCHRQCQGFHAAPTLSRTTPCRRGPYARQTGRSAARHSVAPPWSPPSPTLSVGWDSTSTPVAALLPLSISWLLSSPRPPRPLT